MLFHLGLYRHVRCLALSATMLSACSQEAPQYPDQVLLLCESTSDCPTDWECLVCPDGRRSIDGCPADAQFCSPQFDNVCGTPEAPAACCGNGNLEAWEACDDGNTQDGDACSSECDEANPCGDGLVDAQLGEVCDDGALNTDAYNLDGPEILCGKSCTGPQPSCGDAVLQEEAGEACDDGNRVHETCPYTFTTCAPVCGPTCQWVPGIPNRCGDGDLDEGEVCDDGNTLDAVGLCNADCTAFICASSQSETDEVITRLGVCGPSDAPREGPSRFISSRFYHACAVGHDGLVRCWGADCGPECNVPQNLGPVIQVTVGYDYSCALKQSGEVICWGAAPAVPSGLDDIVILESGGLHLCGLSSNGRVSCWGDDTYGQATPPTDLTEVWDLGMGDEHTCAMHGENNQVTCWGRSSGRAPSELQGIRSLTAGGGNNCAVLGTGGVACWWDPEHSDPVAAPDLSRIASIEAGYWHMCGVTDFGVVECWGVNDSEQLNVPAQLSDSKRVVAGADFSCSLSQGGVLTCWGSQAVGPREPMTIRQSAVGSRHLCILTSDAQVRCFGDNRMNQLEYPDDLGPIVDLDAGFAHTCAVEQSGRLHCWGGNDYEQVSLTPEGLTSIAQVELGGDHSCALRRDGEVVCWGFNSQGQASVPSQLEPSEDLAVGFAHSCALSDVGTVRCWGDNTHAQLNIPSGLGVAVDIEANGNTTCGKRDDGELFCWGSNERGQNDIPTSVGRVDSFSVGSTHVCAASSTGLICWGFDNGKLLNVPSGLPETLSLDASLNATCSVSRSGQIQCWGNDDLVDLDIPMQLDITLGFQDAPFGFMPRSTYQFEPICVSNQVFELGVMDSATGAATLKLGCFNTSGTYVVTCGDGNVDDGETCDDGNRLDGDGCNALCQTE